MDKEKRKFLSEASKELRKNMTKEEVYLWNRFLKDLPYTVNRQKVIGDYIVDFYCAYGRIVIELDGSQHYYGEVKESDEIRDKYMKKNGITVLRYSNYYIYNNFEGVCTDILRHIEAAKDKNKL